MIGVIADSADHDVVREFFELFKTPWEFFKPDRKYEVLLCAGDFNFDETAKLILRYSGSKIAFDDRSNSLSSGKHPHPLASGKPNPDLWELSNFSGNWQRHSGG